MRILGFSEMWPKLQRDQFTTFRFQRKDKDWQVEECVQVFNQPRSKGRRFLGIARIVKKVPRCTSLYWQRHREPTPPVITDEEAIADGFKDASRMDSWLYQAYGLRPGNEPLNMLTLVWVKKEAS